MGCNTNINNQDEFEKRYKAATTVSKYYSKDVIKEKYNHLQWLEAVKGLELEPEKGLRCLECFKFSFELTALKALELGINTFTSTLTISPHKNSKEIIKIGLDVARKYGINFLSIDFCKDNGFKKSVDLSKELDLYRQKYCGCEFSIWW